MPEILFLVGNHHVADSGQLEETLDGNDGNYHSYFENQYGEQWVFTYNRKDDMVYIRGGALGWDSVLGLQHLRAHIFSEEEKLWLNACVHAIKAGDLAEYID